jgi:hypothetical protein
VVCIVLDFLIAHKPVLFINHEGITVNRMPTLSSFFISWAEIESISIRHMLLNRHLCIRAKNTNEFLTRFHIVERLNRSSNMLFGTPPLTVAELYLDRPAKEILHLLYYMYTNELSYYHVRLQP